MLITVSCDLNKVELPEQEEGYNPIRGTWISVHRWSEALDSYNYSVKYFTENYRFIVDVYSNGKKNSSNEHKYVIDQEKIYYDTGNSDYWKIENDSILYFWNKNIDSPSIYINQAKIKKNK